MTLGQYTLHKWTKATQRMLTHHRSGAHLCQQEVRTGDRFIKSELENIETRTFLLPDKKTGETKGPGKKPEVLIVKKLELFQDEELLSDVIRADLMWWGSQLGL